jgi:hypothetical protein
VWQATRWRGFRCPPPSWSFFSLALFAVCVLLALGGNFVLLVAEGASGTNGCSITSGDCAERRAAPILACSRDGSYKGNAVPCASVLMPAGWGAMHPTGCTLQLLSSGGVLGEASTSPLCVAIFCDVLVYPCVWCRCPRHRLGTCPFYNGHSALAWTMDPQWSRAHVWVHFCIQPTAMPLMQSKWLLLTAEAPEYPRERRCRPG